MLASRVARTQAINFARVKEENGENGADVEATSDKAKYEERASGVREKDESREVGDDD